MSDDRNVPEPANPWTVACELVHSLIVGWERVDRLSDWLQRPLHWLWELKVAPQLAIYEARSGVWRRLASEGGGGRWPPESLLASAADQQRPVADGLWWACPIGWGEPEVLVLAVRPELPRAEVASREVDGLDQLAVAIGDGLAAWRNLQLRQRQAAQQARMLAVAADWHAQPDLSALLRHIAETAAELLLADRASIFLWDRSNQTLVAHPALGVDGEPLRIPQGAGLAGQVLSGREPRRWDRLQADDEVDRSIDLQLGYQTESLLAVPMLDSNGSALGVFEVLNHRDGYFTELDQTLLVQLAQHAAAAVANTQQRQRLLAWQAQAVADNRVELIGSCPAMVSLRKSVERVAATELSVLLLGENGTGKDVVSRYLHHRSRHRQGPMVAVNCAALPETLLESELFGHEKGAFTDAGQRRSGKFESADGGTLLLDEIGDMSLAGQAKLLRVLEERVVTPIGGNRTIAVDVRLIAATNQNLLEMVKQKRFREDLFFRLSVVTLELPPLRERQRDVLELAHHFLEAYSAQRGQPPPQLRPSAERALLEHTWPGNVRELRNVIERLVFLSDCRQVEGEDLSFVRSPWGGGGSGGQEAASLASADPLASELGLSEATTQFQQQYVMRVLAACGGSVTQAARRLKLQRANLYRKLKQLGISSADLRE